MIMMIPTTARTRGPRARVLLERSNPDRENEIDQCDCGNDKFVGHRTCKKCAVADGRYEITIEPGQVPCPTCGDGRDPKFALCTSCSKVKHLINRDGTRLEACPMDRCKCGRRKRAVFAECSRCWKQTRPARNQFLWR